MKDRLTAHVIGLFVLIYSCIVLLRVITGIIWKKPTAVPLIFNLTSKRWLSKRPRLVLQLPSGVAKPCRHRRNGPHLLSAQSARASSALACQAAQGPLRSSGTCKSAALLLGARADCGPQSPGGKLQMSEAHRRGAEITSGSKTLCDYAN